MNKGIFVVGTDTEVGKSVVSAGLAFALRHKGVDVGVMKPVASGCISRGNSLISEDAVFLMEAAKNQFTKLISPVRLKEPLAPILAAEMEDKQVNIRKVLVAYRELRNKHEYIVVEGAGGIFCPLTRDYYVVDLVKDMKLSVLVVARIGLGTINHTLLTVESLRARGIEVKGIVLNGLSPESTSVAELTNPKLLASLTDVPVLGVLPKIEFLSVEKCIFGELEESFLKNIHYERLLNGTTVKADGGAL